MAEVEIQYMMDDFDNFFVDFLKLDKDLELQSAPFNYSKQKF
jgi:hypothetical protein